jgi:hypothetical protein
MMHCDNFFEVWESKKEIPKKTCKECESPILARGLCSKHYMRVRYRGLEPLPIHYARQCRKSAKEAGKKYYNTGVRCANGHNSDRRVSTGQCIKCAKQRVIKFTAINPNYGKEIKERYNERCRTNLDLWASNAISCIRARARKKGIPFNLTVQDILDIIPKDRKCSALGVQIIWGGRNGKMHSYSPSIDRINPRLGYVPGNVAMISKKANTMKQDITDSNELRLLANWMDNPLDYTKS